MEKGKESKAKKSRIWYALADEKGRIEENYNIYSDGGYYPSPVLYRSRKQANGMTRGAYPNIVKVRLVIVSSKG